jgi:hypothetical protein
MVIVFCNLLDILQYDSSIVVTKLIFDLPEDSPKILECLGIANKVFKASVLN